MAIFYQMIKGVINNSKATETNKLLYSYITWPFDGSNLKDAPNFKVSTSNIHSLAGLEDKKIVTDCGKFLLSRISNKLEGKIVLDGNSTIGTWNNDNKDVTYLQKDKNDTNLAVYGTLNFYNSKESTQLITVVKNGAITTSNFAVNGGTFAVDVPGTFSKGINVTGESITVNNGHVEAKYFNATSDRRAKEDIQLFSTNALDIIKRVQVKSFKFKTEPNQLTFGIIAQELQEQAPELNLVNNLQADGKTSFMSIKEDRLIYLLWKAVQEQQIEIEKLRSEIAALKRGE